MGLFKNIHDTDPRKLIQPVQSDIQDKVDRFSNQVESLQAALNVGKGAKPKKCIKCLTRDLHVTTVEGKRILKHSATK